MKTLTEALKAHIKAARQDDWSNLAIDDICLDSLFLSVRLTDGSIGISMNYDLEGHTSVTPQQIDDARDNLLSRLADDPLLWELLSEPTESQAQMALCQAVLSALSAPILADPEALKQRKLETYPARLPLSVFSRKAKTATIVGFGGYLEQALSQEWLKKVNCCDFLAHDEGFKARNPYPFQLKERAEKHKEVVYDDGSQARELIEEADIVCLSASTLSNGSLEALLPSQRKGRVVIVEGPSGGILPEPLFERGVTHLVYNPVDVDFVELSHRFSSPNRKGLQSITTGRFIDILLPEQQTLRGPEGLGLEEAQPAR